MCLSPLRCSLGFAPQGTELVFSPSTVHSTPCFAIQTVDWCNWDSDAGHLGPLESNREALAIAKDTQKQFAETKAIELRKALPLRGEYPGMAVGVCTSPGLGRQGCPKGPADGVRLEPFVSSCGRIGTACPHDAAPPGHCLAYQPGPHGLQRSSPCPHDCCGPILTSPPSDPPRGGGGGRAPPRRSAEGRHHRHQHRHGGMLTEGGALGFWN